MTKSGFVAIVGQPNVGKSTLINAMLGEKVSIISEKPETTRDNIRGILTEGDSQIVFTDTPGIHRPHDLLGKLMVSRAKSMLLDSDIIVMMTEHRYAFNENDMSIVAQLPRPEEKRPVILVINKVDKIKKKELMLPTLEKAAKLYPFREIVPMCSLEKKDVKRLLDLLKSCLPEGEFHYPEEDLTDKDERFIIGEVIREKVLCLTREEVPHSVAVVVDDIKEDEKTGRSEVQATIYVERASQKPIVVGKAGSKLKEIGSAARLELEKLLNRKIYLGLWVRVREKWKKDPQALGEFGYTD